MPAQQSYYGPWLVEPKDVFTDAETAVKNLTEEQIAEFRNAFRLVIFHNYIRKNRTFSISAPDYTMKIQF